MAECYVRRCINSRFMVFELGNVEVPVCRHHYDTVLEIVNKHDDDWIKATRECMNKIRNLSETSDRKGNH